MGSRTDYLGFEAEAYLLAHGTWEAEGVPPEVIDRAGELLEEKVPVGIAKHPARGWMILMSLSTGPTVAWQEER